MSLLSSQFLYPSIKSANIHLSINLLLSLYLTIHLAPNTQYPFYTEQVRVQKPSGANPCPSLETHPVCRGESRDSRIIVVFVALLEYQPLNK